MAELADQEHVPGVDEGDDADGGADVQHGIAALVARRQPPGVLAQRQLAEALQRRGAEEMPRRPWITPWGKPPGRRIIPVLSYGACRPTRTWTA